jgi:alkylation response protein AidB-like acyl-CoA dehydrogenase
MNFDLSKEQQMIVDSVATFVKEESNVERFREMRDTETGWDKDIWKQMGDYGWLGIAFPEQYGGIDGSFIDMALILEQLGRGLAPEPFIPSVVLAGTVLLDLGSEEQKTGVLAPMLLGDTSLALAYAERQSRYNLSDCLTTAKKDGDSYSLQGEKTWVLNGHAADQILVVARTSGDQLDSEGLSIFLVDANDSKVSKVLIPGMDGHKTANLEFKGASGQLVGEIGKALPTLEWAIDRGAAAACAEGQGHLKEMLDRTIEYLKQREQFGRKIGTFQALQHRAADMFAEVELCKGTMILAALMVDSDDREERTSEISAAKVQLGRGGWFVQENAIQLHGGIGITDETDVGLFFKRLRVLQGLFGDVDFHTGRFESSRVFNGAA